MGADWRCWGKGEDRGYFDSGRIRFIITLPVGSHTPPPLHILHGTSGSFGGLLLLLRLLLGWLAWPLAVAAAAAHRRHTTATCRPRTSTL